MVSDDDEIEDSRVEEQSLTGAAKRTALEKKKILGIFSKQALRAKRAKDARAYGSWLRRVGIREGSVEWKNAWKYFYSD